jgi:hypothetical protein
MLIASMARNDLRAIAVEAAVLRGSPAHNLGYGHDSRKYDSRRYEGDDLENFREVQAQATGNDDGWEQPKEQNEEPIYDNAPPNYQFDRSNTDIILTLNRTRIFVHHNFP